jgi:hypothetical protein
MPFPEGPSVQTYQINVSKGRDQVQEIRRELFAFSEILEVFATSRPDALIVVCGGRPRAGDWLRALRAIGYEASARRRAGAGMTGIAAPPPATPVSGVDRTEVAVRFDNATASPSRLAGRRAAA